MGGGLWHERIRRARIEIAFSQGRLAEADSLFAEVGGDQINDDLYERLLRRRFERLQALGDRAGILQLIDRLVRQDLTPRVAGLLAETLSQVSGAVDGDLTLKVWRAAMNSGMAKPALRLAQRQIATLDHINAMLWPSRLAESLRVSGDLRRAMTPIRSAPEWYARTDYEAALALAHIYRDAGALDSSFAAYERSTRPSGFARDAGWEGAQLAEAHGRLDRAKRLYWMIGGSSPRPINMPRFRFGLMLFVDGDIDSAAALWKDDPMDASRFWYGVARRALRDTTAGNAALRDVAMRPGYEFYRTAARESLGMRWRDNRTEQITAEYGPFPYSSCDDYSAALALAAIGDTTEASKLVERLSHSPYQRGWAREDYCDYGVESLFGSAVAYAIGNVPAGIKLAHRALPDPAAQWRLYRGRIVWAYPMLATGAQSEFEDQSSMSLALAVQREKLLSGETGAEVRLAELPALRRKYRASLAMALRALRPGEDDLVIDWRRLYSRGGDALICEIASDSKDATFARNVLAARSAYSELKPW
jgi:tetratricopeptide (TPR) repeat protein